MGVCVITATQESDQQFRIRLGALTIDKSDFWSFKGNSCREHGHGLFQYPAMMVPQLARAILEEACAIHSEIEWIADPFSGSGTILTESMLRGLNFVGNDINPLAILLCRTKAGPFFTNALEGKVSEIKAKIDADRSSRIEVDFPNRDKWFRSDVQKALSKIRRAIIREQAPWARRFFWVALAETVRLTSNSRTSTFKLHTRPQKEIESRTICTIDTFKNVIDRNLGLFTEQASLLKKEGLLNGGHYRGKVEIILNDVRNLQYKNQCDLIITSPPYGDNKTTVTYGQHSYLPLQWIDLADVHPGANGGFLSSTHEIDTRSLGGRKRIDSETRENLCDRSPTLSRFLSKLKNQPAERTKRVIAFFRDLDYGIEPILNMLGPGGLMVWVLGNRKVGGSSLPLDKIFSEFLIARNASLLTKIKRKISGKRMALKNNIAETMCNETILVLRKSM
jgi:hypothetical protein